ncbi:unnamed protein product [Phyllotreta striolata]|uniref:Nucleoporin Nup159/Nup146 N-terminal domain-containing protein n=1 Tax=Phyllotreta striolata TaxID=444603 RepID=A0A9P0GRV3_PHYSR|nr:unnamed protein product [Phyllotreta striolata]
MLKTCPDPIDVQDINFKLHCSLEVFKNNDLGTFAVNQSLISCASRYGLLFVGTNLSVLKVIQLKCVENFTPKDKVISQFPRRNVPLPSPSKHVCVNCDNTLLAVVIEKDSCPIVLFYEVLSFYKKNINVINEVRLSSTPGVHVTEINWNPAVPNIFTASKSDGSLGNYELKGNSVDINEIPAAAECSSFCWSPKGKQIAVGSKNGNITQYKPDLKAVKVIQGPKLESPHSLISLCWISNYQFIGVYQALQEDGQAKLIVIDAPKTGEPVYTNYEDVCYSGTSRKPQFYFTLLQNWNMLMVASSNSMELGLLGSVSDVWTQWIVPDFARAELPLSPDKQDTLPIGMALDVSNTQPLPWQEGFLSPCPYILLLSHVGVLYFFNIVNLKAGIPSICCPPDNITDMSGMDQFVFDTIETVPKSVPQASSFSFGAIEPQKPSIQPANPQIQTSSSFNFAKPAPLPSFAATTMSAPPNVSLFDKSVENKPAFGAPSNLVPVKPQPHTEASSVHTLFKNPSISLTPIAKTPTVPGENQKYSPIFSALQTPIAESKPAVVSSQTVAVSEAPETQIPRTPKNMALDVTKGNVDVKTAVGEKVKIETEALLANMVRDECLALESELKALLHQGRKININIGTDDEKTVMVEKLEDLKEFIKEIVDISLGESAEIHTLKQNLILSWAWYEEALSRYNISKDETMTTLLKIQPLDSAAEKRQSDIRKIFYYLESQLYQASKALDEQWEKFQDYAKKSYKVKMPTMETIFQSLVRQSAILQKQSYILKDITSRLKSKRPSTNASLFLSINNADELEESLSRLQLDPDDGHKILYEQAIKRNKKQSSSKCKKIRNLLNIVEVTHITVVKPQLNNSISLIKSPTAKNKLLVSLLGAQMSPVPKPSFSKQLNFMESTPIKFTSTTVPPNTPAQPDTHSKLFAFKGGEPRSIVVPSRAMSSAFVSTTSKPSSVSSLTDDPSCITISNPSQFDFSGSSTTSAIQKQESAPVVSTFTGNAAVGFVTPQHSMAFSKSTVDSTALSSVKSDGIASFSFGKSSLPATADTTSTIVKYAAKPVAVSVPKATIPENRSDKTTSITMKPTVLSAPNVSTKTSTIPTMKPISFGASTIKPTDVATTTATTTSKLAGFKFNAATTTTTSLFGSITSPTVVSSMFSAKPIVTSDAFVSKKVDAAVASSGNSLFSTIPPKASETAVGIVSSTVTTQFGSATGTNTTIFNTDLAKSNTTSIFATSPATAELPSSSVSAIASQISSSETTKPSIFGQPTVSISSSNTANANLPLFTSASATSQTSIFGGSPKTTQSPSFGSLPVSSQSISKPDSTSAPISIFNTSAGTVASTTASIFGSSSISTATSAPTQPVFGVSNVSAASSVASPSIFGSSNIAATAAATSSSIFGSSSVGVATTAAASPSIFGSIGSLLAASPPTYESSTSSQSVVSSSSAATSQPSIFGATDTSGPTTTTQPSIFGASTTSSPATTAQSIFGSATNTTSIFGGAATSTQPSVFGSNTTGAPASVFGGRTTQSSIFGSNSQTSAFGAVSPTTQPSLFGGTTSSSGSIFGGTPTTQTSIFGSTTTTTQSSVFGTNVSSTSSGSIFDNANASPAFGGGSGFAQSSSIFGAKTTTSSFGSPNAFGMVQTTTAFNQSAPFGGNTASVFGGTPTTSSGVFGNNFGAVSSSGGAFGSAANSSFSFASAGNTGGSLGFGDLNVASSPTSGGSIFGGSSGFGQTPPANPFAKAGEQKSPFGASPSIFGTPSSTSSSIFGANAGASAFGGTTQNAFGSPSGFGQPATFGQSTFGGSPTFGSNASGPFSAGGAGVGQTGFSSTNVFQKSPQGSGFGTPPVFGGTPKPAFGTNPSFGSSPAFGAAPAFGSPSKVFGAASPSSTFGQSTENAAFGNLATQNTVGFGSLAQQAANTSSVPFSGNSSFSNWR